MSVGAVNAVMVLALVRWSGYWSRTDRRFWGGGLLDIDIDFSTATTGLRLRVLTSAGELQPGVAVIIMTLVTLAKQCSENYCFIFFVLPLFYWTLARQQSLSLVMSPLASYVHTVHIRKKY